MADAYTLDDDEVAELLTRFDAAFERLESTPGPTTDVAFDVIELLTQLYGTALERIAGMVPADVLSTVADDELVGHLLALHGLHPLPVVERIAGALAGVRSQLGNDAEVLLDDLAGGTARVTVKVAGCGSAVASTAAAVRDAVLEAAPELTDVEAVVTRPPQAPALIPTEALLRAPGRRR